MSNESGELPAELLSLPQATESVFRVLSLLFHVIIFGQENAQNMTHYDTVIFRITL